MITIEGKSVFGGVSIGKLMFYKRNEKVIRRTHVDDVDAEWKRFEEAKNTAIDQLKVLYDKAIEDVGEANAMIFEIHQMMLGDLDYLEERYSSLKIPYVIRRVVDDYIACLESRDERYADMSYVAGMGDAISLLTKMGMLNNQEQPLSINAE